MPSYPKLKLIYFDGPGRAEATRLAFHIAGIPFEDERLTHEQFAQRKPTFVYGQLPVLQVDGVEIAESEAILRYAGKLAGLYPVNDPLAALQVDEILAGFEEMNSKIMPTFFEQDEEKKKAMRAELATVTIPRYLSILDGRLAEMKQNPVFQADQLFIHELIVFSQLLMLTSGFFEGIPTDIAEGYTEIQAAYSKVAAHPKVQQWRAMHAKPGQPKLKLTYFDGPGRAEPIRLAFAIGGIEFEDERVDHDKLTELKPSLPFGQLPVLEVDGKVVAQSLPLLRYAGTLSGLYPTNDPLLAFRADEIVSLSDDVFAAAVPVLHEQDSEKRAEAAKTLVETTLPRIIANLDKRIASWGGPYAVGKTLTIADLIVYSLVAGFKMYTKRGLPEMSLDAFENVVRVHAQVMDHEKVQAWNAQHTA